MQSVLRKLAKTDAAWAVNKQFCKWLCHTNIGVQFHIFGRNSIKKAQKFYAGNNNTPPPSETAAKFRKDGYAVRKELYPAELMATIKKKFETLMKDEKNYSFSVSADYQGPEKNVRQALNDPLDHIPEIAQLITDDVRANIEGYYGSYFKILRIIVWRNLHIPKEYADHEALSNFWHFDQCTTALFNMFVTISDVTEQDGPFHTQPRQRSDELVKMGYKNRYDYGLPLNELEDKKYVVKHTGPSGKVMYASTPTCLHRAGIPEEGHYRDMLTFQFMPSNEPLPENWADDFVDHGPLK